jgi:predicted DNA-binding helix-hairpin-helix protein
MVIGATPESDYQIMSVADEFYKNYQLKRVYYSGYIPVNSNNALLPQVGTQPPLIRENRLYQTDWLLRFYDFKLDEILNPQFQNLDMDIDPKLGWALRNPQFFPIDINTADYKQIIRIPGIGRQSAMKIIKARKFGKLREYQLKKIGISYNRAKFFMICADSPFTLGEMSMMHVKQSILQFGNSKYKNRIPENQLSLF